jgi:hypothetical protein
MQQDNGDYKATISDCNTNFKNHEVLRMPWLLTFVMFRQELVAERP